MLSDPFVYMWLSLTSIPPEYDALPVNYPGNPVQLASLDVISINRTGHCSISTKIAQDSPRTTPRSKISESFSIDYIYVVCFPLIFNEKKKEGNCEVMVVGQIRNRRQFAE